ncbi:hypothetical protein J3T72_02220 [Staphylococcus simiae]|uniref:hypothetical protein n=1 Tax=Staphylococcus simiae TaxID=308354 RepID=UPI001A96D54A|nr:hypothetical protein [Staphylococcus simiae]MBO1200473.1 hypothetical protein [Staphylococcus simiae]MBO1228890.1 hypothetical protein [Staphylococcus simiae]QSY52924.1 hypothetical protein J3R86_06500 [Staphylococcus simiae]
MVKKYIYISLLLTILSFITMALPIIWYQATVIWFIPGAIIITVATLLLLACYLKYKNRVILTLFIINILILIIYSSPLILS